MVEAYRAPYAYSLEKFSESEPGTYGNESSKLTGDRSILLFPQLTFLQSVHPRLQSHCQLPVPYTTTKETGNRRLTFNHFPSPNLDLKWLITIPRAIEPEIKPKFISKASASNHCGPKYLYFFPLAKVPT